MYVYIEFYSITTAANLRQYTKGESGRLKEESEEISEGDRTRERSGEEGDRGEGRSEEESGRPTSRSEEERERATLTGISEENLDDILSSYYQQISSRLNFTEEDKKQIVVSLEAFWAEENVDAPHRRRSEREMNGEIITDSESDNPDVYLCTPNTREHANTRIAKKVAAIGQQTRRLEAKFIEKQHFLCRHKSKV